MQAKAVAYTPSRAATENNRHMTANLAARNVVCRGDLSLVRTIPCAARDRFRWG